ncbi:MAG: DUF1570 domain-containing protein [Phycisphaerae bacterium]
MTIGVLRAARSAALALTTLISACDTTGTRTFDAPDFKLARAEWRFESHQGTHLSTDHFDIYTTSYDAELNDYLPEFLETTFQFYASLLPPPAGSTEQGLRLKTYVFANRSEWDRFVKRRFPRRYPLYRMISAGGFSEGTTCVVYDIGRASTLSVLAHEGTHQYFAAHFTEPLPAWLNEGLATYCEAVEFRKNKPYFTPQRNTFRINHLRRAVADGTAIPLEKLLATNAGEVIEGNRITDTAAYYAQAWALVVYLRHAGQGRYADSFETMLHDVAGGTIRIKAQQAKALAPSPSQTSYGEAVFRAYFTTDLEEFEKGFRRFVDRLCWDT